jgi:hypothetical protein
MWISVAVETKTIELFTFIRKAAQDEAAVVPRLNDLNMSFVLGQYYLYEDAIFSRHSVSFDGGLLPRQFVKMVRRFAGSFREATSEMGDLLVGEESRPLTTE